jgi:hypothetical protein
MTKPRFAKRWACVWAVAAVLTVSPVWAQDQQQQAQPTKPGKPICNLETGPETFQLVTNSDAQAAQLKNFVGKEISVKVEEVSCAQAAGQMTEAVVTKWSVVTKR